MVSATRQLATVLNFQGRVDPSVERAVNGLTGVQRRVARQLIDDNYRQQRAVSATARQVVGGTRNLQSYSQELRNIRQSFQRVRSQSAVFQQLLAVTGDAAQATQRYDAYLKDTVGELADVDQAARQYSTRINKVEADLTSLYSTPFGRQQRQQFEELQKLASGAADDFQRWRNQAQWVNNLDDRLKQARDALAGIRTETRRVSSAGRGIEQYTRQVQGFEEELEQATRQLERLKLAEPGPGLVRSLRDADNELAQINRRLAQSAEETRNAAAAAERWQRRLQRVDRVAGGIRNAGFGLAAGAGGVVAATLLGGEQAAVHREAALQAGFSLEQYFVNTQALRRLGARDQIDLQRELGKEGRARLVDPSEETVFAIQRIAEARGQAYETTQRDLISTLSGPNAVRDIVLEVRRAGKDLQPFFAEALIGGEGGERLLEVVTRTTQDIEQAFAQASPELAASLDVSTETLADMRIGMENLQFRGQLLQSSFATGLIPLMTEFAETITPAVMGLQNFAEENPRAAQAVAGLTLTIGGLGTGMTVIGLLAPGLIRSIHGIRAAVAALTLVMRANPLFAIGGLLATAAALGVGAFLINRFVSATPYEPANRVPRETTGEIITTGLEGSEESGRGRGRRDPRTGILLEGIPFQPITPVGSPCPELAEMEKQTAILEDIKNNTLPTPEEAESIFGPDPLAPFRNQDDEGFYDVSRPLAFRRYVAALVRENTQPASTPLAQPERVGGISPSDIAHGPLGIDQGIRSPEERRLAEARTLNPSPVIDRPEESSSGFFADLARFLGFGARRIGWRHHQHPG